METKWIDSDPTKSANNIDEIENIRYARINLMFDKMPIGVVISDKRFWLCRNPQPN